MFKAPSSIWIDPRVVIKLFARTVEHSVRNVDEFAKFVKDRQFRVTVEAWRASMYLVALSRMTNVGRFYLQHNPKDPPDFFGLHVYERDSRVRGREIEIEVFQVAEESSSIKDEFRKKLEKRYSPKTVLVGQIRKSGNNSIQELRDMVASLSPRNEVWFIAGTEEGLDSESMVCQLFPDLTSIVIDVRTILEEEINPYFVRANKGISQQLEFTDLGILRLDSRFNLHEDQ